MYRKENFASVFKNRSLRIRLVYFKSFSNILKIFRVGSTRIFQKYVLRKNVSINANFFLAMNNYDILKFRSYRRMSACVMMPG